MYKTVIHLTLILITLNGCFSHKSKKNPPKPEIQPRAVSADKQALIVATGNYKGSDKDLLGIYLDAKRMRELFTSWGFTVTMLENEKSMGFEKNITSFAKTLSPDDVFILYFSGHGSSTKDNSGDEEDGRDELMVISDGENNRFILDDKIDDYLSAISARKFIIFDSCNSGSINRSIDRRIKYIPAPPEVGDSPNMIMPIQPLMSTNSSGPYIFLAASQDNERSIATENGSLFTNTLLTKIDLDKSINDIYNQTLNALDGYFHPKIDSSNKSLQSEKLRTYLKIQ